MAHDPKPDSAASDPKVIELQSEQIEVRKRVRRTLVRATRTTYTRDQVVEQDLARETVVIERVPIGRVVDAVPPVREEDGVTIMPVVEEMLVLERRLILKEEVHIRRVHTTERFKETVSLREQEVTVTRTGLDE